MEAINQSGQPRNSGKTGPMWPAPLTSGSLALEEITCRGWGPHLQYSFLIKLASLGVWSLGLFSPTFFSTSSKKKKKLILPDREASLIKKEYCRCGPHPLQVISSRARPPLVKGAGHIGPLFPEFRGWPLWFMASIALRGL